MTELSDSKSNLSATELLAAAENKLKECGNPLARRDAEILLAHILVIEPSALPIFSKPVSQEQSALFDDMIARRLTGEPVAYITGVQGFWSLDFHVNPHTLIPRPDTELLVEVGLNVIKGSTAPRIADLGTGSGCILLSILSEHSRATGIGADISVEALKVAQCNAETHGLATRAQFIESDWFKGFGGPQFDLIVSNPPYIPADDIEALMSDVKDFEPTAALNGGHDGLDYYRQITSHATAYLAKEGHLAFEVGIGQFADVSALLARENFRDIRFFPDLSGINRVVMAKKPQES